MSLLAWFGRHGRWWLAAGVGIGLLLPDLAWWLRPALPPIIAFTLTMSLLRLDFRLVRDHLMRPRRLAWMVAILLLASPLAVWLATMVLPAGLARAVTLMAAAPTITSAPAFALLVGLEAEFAVAAVLATHALAPLSLPPLALALTGLSAELSLTDLALRLLLLVGSAFAASALLKKLLPADWLARQAPALDGLAVLGLLAFAIAVMAGATEVLLARPGYFFAVLALSFVANAALQVFGAALAWRAGPRIALTVGFMAGNCNMGLVLASLGPAAGPDISLYFALAQVPMYCMPLLATPIYRRIIDRRS
jgi:BASS family bile acid:Na+ symporter